MNRERMLELADAIENRTLDREFDMRSFCRDRDQHDVDTSCGTAGCIAGWACWLFTEGTTVQYDDIETVAIGLLDLTGTEADSLFHGWWSPEILPNITAEDAAAELRRLASQEQV